MKLENDSYFVQILKLIVNDSEIWCKERIATAKISTVIFRNYVPELAWYQKNCKINFTDFALIAHQ
jgi:hypothetical protein